ncbi:MAG: LLM class flavin-dependent oxidoreductase [Acidimicrobiales bacterium]
MSADEPVPISCALMPDAPVAAMAELAQLAEGLGYTRCWVYDEGLVARDVYVTLTAIALVTSRIPLGPGITNPYVRHPGATAAAIASLDELSGGRAFVGIGAGGGLTLDPMRISRQRPLTAVRDMVEALRLLFSGAEVDQESHVAAFRNARLTYGRPDIEIILAGRGPKMTAMGGEIADGFNLSYIHKGLLGEHVTSLRRAAAGRPFRVTYSTLIAATDADLRQARSQLTFRLVDSPPVVKEMIGMTPEDVERIRAALNEGGPAMAAEHVKEEWVEHFIIAGSAAECRRELVELMTTNGIDEFQLPVLEASGGAEMIERAASMLGPQS